MGPVQRRCEACRFLQQLAISQTAPALHARLIRVTILMPDSRSHIPHISPRSRASLKLKAEHSKLVRQVLLPAQQYIHTEGYGGIALFASAVIALLWANSRWSGQYFHLLHTRIGFQIGEFSLYNTLQHWVNDGLMTIFFFVVGLEIKREAVRGELADLRQAALPVVAAFGGMLVPAAIYLTFTLGTPLERGWGIPMATDIAFALGALALVGRRVPHSLKVLLLALAVVDDIGAILVIAIFYTEKIAVLPLISALLLFVLIVVMQRLGIQRIGAYVVVAAGIWLAALATGVHPTIAGVIVGLITPSVAASDYRVFSRALNGLQERFDRAVAVGDRDAAEAVLGYVEQLASLTEPPLDRIERSMHFWSSFVVLPIFAFTNAGVSLSADAVRTAIFSPVLHGIVLGLIAGKLIGILGFSWLATRLGLTRLPNGLSWGHLAGMGLVAGIGFTVSLFITELAFEDSIILNEAKIGILMASLASGILGYTFLRLLTGQREKTAAH
jgi:NhaA family Na+:H+ antiporter